MFENTVPTTKSTSSRSTSEVALSRATSGLSSSSSTISSIFWPPNMPSFSSSASWNPSTICCPSAAGGPESVTTIPILMSSARAIDPSAVLIARLVVRYLRCFFMFVSPWFAPCYFAGLSCSGFMRASLTSLSRFFSHHSLAVEQRSLPLLHSL